MAKKVLTWSYAGPAREAAVEVPPVSTGNYGYALAYDETRRCVIYVRARDYGGELESWTYSGGAFAKGKGSGRIAGDEAHVYYDPVRRGVAWWSTEHDPELGRDVPQGVLVTDGKIARIKTTGDAPLVEPDSEETFFLSSNIGCTVAFDRARGVAVCLTRRGVWELDANNAWKRVAEASKLLPAWHAQAGGTWDPVGKRVVFWVQGRDNKYKHVFVAWDGKVLSPIATKGLPDLCIGFFDPVALFAGHAEHGVIGVVGGALYALDGNAWRALPTPTGEAPPKLTDAQIAVTPTGLLVGPGHHDGDEGGADAQQVFFELRGTTWKRLGAAKRASKLVEIYGDKRHVVVGDAWYATALRDLRTLRATATDWEEVVGDKASAKLLGNERIGGVAATPDGLVAVSEKGAVYRLAGTSYKLVAKASPVFKQRTGFLLVHDGTRLVAWGGEVKSRKANDTLVFDGKRWTAVKTASPQPKDLAVKGRYVDFPAVFDTALGRVVRFGLDEVAVLEGDRWVPYAIPSYTKLVGPSLREHVPVHDAASGETLLIHFQARRVIRFDLAKCEEVATFAWDKEIEARCRREDADVASYYTEHFAYRPSTRSLEVARQDDATFRYTLDLAPAFAAAKACGPRKLLGPVRPAGAKPTYYRFSKGKLDVTTKPAPGFVTAGELSHQVLEAIGTKASSALSVSTKQPASHATSRLGGLPSGIGLDRWPKLDGQPMGFLFQLVTDERAVAVFVPLDGTATEDDDRTKVVVLSKADLAKRPIAAPPEGVPMLKARAIAIGPALPEVDDGVIAALVAKDPELGAAFDRYQAAAKVQAPQLSSKLGGKPAWVQDGPSNVELFAQLDFDAIALDKAWRAAGLAGCIYILPSKRGATALWQYT